MPSLLSQAYGNSFVVDMEPITSKFVNNEQLGVSCQLQKTGTKPEPLSSTNHKLGQGSVEDNFDRNYVIQITINQDDCHLLCLFIGVFTLAVLFSRDRKGSLP